MFSFLSKLFPDKTLSRMEGVVSSINKEEAEIEKLNNDELKNAAQDLKKQVQENGGTEEDLNSALPKMFALAREAAKRTLKQRHFDVQLIGGAVLHEGKIAQMLTGEGKTLVATLPASLNSLAGKGVHVITVNDYLAKRDAVWMGQIYNALGLSVSCIVHDAAYIYDPTFEGSSELDKERDTTGSFKIEEKFLRPITRREAYAADITYGTNHEFGFDHLRDNLTLRLSDRVQREYSYAIIDEIDSILIDEARTPLIIASPDRESSEFYKVFARVVDKLSPEIDYTVDEKLKVANITEEGIEKVEKTLGIQNIFAPENSRLVHFLHESLKAKALFKRDRDYLVKNGEVFIVDEFTGRVLFGRRYSGGLHQAIEAKEGVTVKEENRTYAQITIQNYFRLYKKISGMTGTAETSAEEFHKVYKLDVVSIPPNKPMIRKDTQDLVYKTKDAKYRAVAEEVKKRWEVGQPVLLGTTSISNNEIISAYLGKAGVPHEVLNAKNNEREGAIIAQAGKLKAVTVATNMAGRGVDIVLGGNPATPDEAQKVKELGGLHVIGTERHEARRIDNQLRGRSGRQGDPGSSQFFLSLEDDLMRIFGGDRIKRLMESVNFPEDTPIESGMISKAVNQAQSKVEGNNFDIRKHLLDFDDVLNKQRTAFYARRKKILEAGEKNELLPILEESLNHHLTFLESRLEHIEGDHAEHHKVLDETRKKIVGLPKTLTSEQAIVGSQHMVRVLDSLWIDHLENLESLRETVNIRAYAQHEPIVEYRREAHILYSQLQSTWNELVYGTIFQLFEIDPIKLKADMERPRQEQPAGAKQIGRNDPCWCGSGKKYKKCHGK